MKILYGKDKNGLVVTRGWKKMKKKFCTPDVPIMVLNYTFWLHTLKTLSAFSSSKCFYAEAQFNHDFYGYSVFTITVPEVHTPIFIPFTGIWKL
jgi:hypothetical protein